VSALASIPGELICWLSLTLRVPYLPLDLHLEISISLSEICKSAREIGIFLPETHKALVHLYILESHLCISGTEVCSAKTKTARVFPILPLAPPHRLAFCGAGF